MVNCYIFFNDALMVGKVSTLVKNVYENINIILVLDPKQILLDNSKYRHAIITDYESYQRLEMADINDQNFEKVLIIDNVDSETDGNIVYINQKYLITEVGSVIDDYIQSNFVDENFKGISITKFYPSLAYPHDLYDKRDDGRYNVVLHTGEKFTLDSLQKLKMQKTESLFVFRDHFSETANFIVSNDKSQTAMDPVKAEITAVEAIHSYFIELGFSERILKLTKSLHESIREEYGHKYMRKLFDKFNSLEGTFLYNHSFLTSVIALTVAEKFSWMNQVNKEKLYLGSILHNLGYKNKEHAEFESLSMEEIKKLEPEASQDVLGHTVQFAMYLGQIDNIHQDIVRMVKYHHSVDYDNAFPQRIPPSEENLIFVLFILSQKLALEFYKINFHPDKISDAINHVCDRYQRDNYLKVIPEFKATMIELLKNK